MNAYTEASFQVLLLDLYFVCGISQIFIWLFPSKRQVTYVLLTRAPLNRVAPVAFDLHVLGAPLTFVLSQDQTLQLDLEKELCLP